MSDINFEVLGRCEHLRAEIQKSLSARDGAYNLIRVLYRPTESHAVYDTVHHADMQKLKATFENLEKANLELTALVDEFNRWAPDAGKSLIKFVAW